MTLQIVNETPMPVNPRLRQQGARRAADYPETEATRASARAHCAEERRKLQEVTGLVVAEDGTVSLPKPITDQGISLQDRLDCAAVIACAVQRFGLPCVVRAVRLEAATAGLYLQLLTDEEADRG